MMSEVEGQERKIGVICLRASTNVK